MLGIPSCPMFIRPEIDFTFSEPLRLWTQPVDGKAADLPREVRPHGLRHRSSTPALDSGRDLRDVRRFTSHRSLEMVLRYDVMRRNIAGEIARDLAGR
jgi:integrase